LEVTMPAYRRTICWTSLLSVLVAVACGTNDGSAGHGGQPGAQGSGGAAVAGAQGSGGAAIAGVQGSGGAAIAGVQGRGGAPSAGAQGNGGAPTATGGSSGACTPDYGCKPTSPNTGDPYADCVARVNQFRACVCLPPLARWSAGEACADQDAQYDSEQNTAHAGFTAKICTAGNAQDECPSWGGSYPSVISGCLQSMFDEGPPPTATCSGSCYQDHGHYINMTGTKYKSGVACGFYTMSSGKIWAVQNFQ
jgi:hypothetical protein